MPLGIQHLSGFLAAGSTVRYLSGRRNLYMYLVLQYGILYLYWWPLVAAPISCKCGKAGIATMACTMRNIIMALACCLLCWRVSHGSDTAGVAIIFCHKSSRSPLDSFYLFDVFCRVWIPYCGCVFHLRPHECFVTSVLSFLWACLQVPSKNQWYYWPSW